MRGKDAFSLALVGALLIGGAGCAANSLELVDGPAEEVLALDNSFDPETIEVDAGTRITFVNRGRNDHNVLPVGDADEALLVEAEDLPPDETATVRLTEPGTHRYYCSLHGTEDAGMIGTIEVTG